MRYERPYVPGDGMAVTRGNKTLSPSVPLDESISVQRTRLF
jgi:hypothetical protein